MQPNYRSRSVSVTSPEQREPVPEFISVGQKLRRQEPVSSTIHQHPEPQVPLHRFHREESPRAPLHRFHREDSAPARIFAEEIKEDPQQRTKQNGTPLPAKYFGSEIKSEMLTEFFIF